MMMKKCFDVSELWVKMPRRHVCGDS